MQTDHTPIPFFPQNLEDYAPWVTRYGLFQPYGKCQCGCSEDAPLALVSRSARDWKRGHPTRFSKGHRLSMTHGVSEKQCTKCEKVKPLDEFYLWGANRVGYTSRCKDCLSEYHQQHYEENKPRIQARNKAYQEAHREELLAYFSRRYAENKEAIEAKRKVYYANNRARIIQYNRELHKRNRERNIRISQQWHASHREESRTIKRRFRAKVAGARNHHTLKEWLDLVKQFDFHCLACGLRFTLDELTTDHIVPLSLGGENSIDNIQPLCSSCNASKRNRTINYRTDWMNKSPG